MCQHKDQLVSNTVVWRGYELSDVVEKFVFGNGHAFTTIYTVMNQPLVYYKNWPQQIETKVLEGHTKFADLDAIIFGPLHNYAGSHGSNFQKNMLAVQEHEQDGMDFQHGLPPTLEDVAKVYPNGTIIYVSMFAAKNQKFFRKAEEWVQQQHQSRLRAVNGRNYILGGGLECANEGGGIVGDCLPPDSPRYREAHRCMGANGGGLVDLAVWDVVEILFEHFEEKRSNL